METILFIASTESDGSLANVTLETLGGAVKLTSELGATLKIGLIGESTDKAAEALSGLEAEAFISATGPEFSQSRYSTDCPAIETLAREAGATIVIAPATSRMNRSVPGAACRLDGRVDSHITGFSASNDGLQVQRWYYRQRMLSTLKRAERPWCLLLEGGVFPAWTGSGAAPQFSSVNVTLDEANLRTEVTGIESPSCEAETIRPEAKLLFVAGAGWTKKQQDGNTHIKDAEESIMTFLTNSGASLGSSKSLVDQTGEGGEVISYMTHLNQIGQTGATPRHQKGLATCCHGEEPHVIGWRFINERRAVNSDANCGWAQGKADVLYVADAFEVVKKVNELLG